MDKNDPQAVRAEVVRLAHRLQSAIQVLWGEINLAEAGVTYDTSNEFCIIQEQLQHLADVLGQP